MGVRKESHIPKRKKKERGEREVVTEIEISYEAKVESVRRCRRAQV